jgi:hypothetical protein
MKFLCRNKAFLRRNLIDLNRIGGLFVLISAYYKEKGLRRRVNKAKRCEGGSFIS